MMPLALFIFYFLMMSLPNSNLKTSLIKDLSDSSFNLSKTQNLLQVRIHYISLYIHLILNPYLKVIREEH